MAYSATVYRVMIASPSDVVEERNLVRKIIQEWNDLHSRDRAIALMPIGWDSHSRPEMGTRPQEIINNQVLRDSDLLVAIFWTRIGSPTGEAISGTVEEIQEHTAGGKPAMIYFSDIPKNPSSVDEEQILGVKKFRVECFKKGLVEAFNSIDDFKHKFTRQLTATLLENPYFSTGMNLKNNSAESNSITLHSNLVSAPSESGLEEKALILLVEASNDSRGVILKNVHMNGYEIRTNGKQLVESPQDPKARANWDAILEKLIGQDLIAVAGKGLYNVTQSGYQAAEQFVNGKGKAGKNRKEK